MRGKVAKALRMSAFQIAVAAGSLESEYEEERHKKQINLEGKIFTIYPSTITCAGFRGIYRAMKKTFREKGLTPNDK